MVAPLWPPKIAVENPDELLNAGSFGAGAKIRLQSSATEGGAYADVSGTGSTPTIPLVAGTNLYTGYDVNATTSTWFRWRIENAGGTKLSDWQTPFQAGNETGSLLCSLSDVKQRLNITDTASDEMLLETIRQVSDEIEEYVGEWLAPRPSDPASTTTLLFDVERTGRSLWLMAGNRRVGVRSLTALGTATTNQAEAGGVYTSITLSGVLLRPRPTVDGPASHLVLSSGYFYTGWNTVSATGSFGPAVVAPRYQKGAIALVELTRNHHPGTSSEQIGAWSEASSNEDGAERKAILDSLNPWPVLA